jgi:hypothetical protein
VSGPYSRLDARLSAHRATRKDGFGSVWQSSDTGLFLGEQTSRLTSEPTLDPLQIEGLLAHDWRARREIVQPGGDLIRGGFEIEGLPEWVDVASVMSWVEGDRLEGETSCGLLNALGDQWMEGESYGGALLVGVFDDGLPSSEPLDLARLRTILGWEVLDRWSVWPYRRNYGGKVDYWVINDYSGEVRPGQIVHPSRVVCHLGMWMPGRWRRRHDGWGLSRLELLRDQRDTLALGSAHMGRLLARGSQDVLTLAEYSEMKAELGDAYVNAQLGVFRSSLSSDGLAIIDGGIEGDPTNHTPGRRGDSFQTMARPMGGASEISDAQHKNWRMGSNMPEVVADGTASGGLNSGEEAGQWRGWDGWCEAEFNRVFVPRLNWGLGKIFAAKEGPTGGRVPDTWQIKRKSIAEPDHKAEAESAEIEARTAQLYFDLGAVTDKEIRQHFLVDAKRGPIKVESAEILREPTPEEIAAEEAAQLAELQGEQETPEGESQPLIDTRVSAAVVEIVNAVLAGDMPAAVARWLIEILAPGTSPEAALAAAEQWAKDNPAPEPPPSPFGPGQPPPQPVPEEEGEEEEA